MDTTGTLFLPPSSSTISGHVDALFYFILYVSIFFFAIVVGLAIYFMIKYRRKGAAEATSGPDHSLKLEIIWTVIPIIIVLIIFFWGFKIYLDQVVVPKDAMEIKVTGKKWMWVFDYPNGVNSVNDLYVPAGKPVKLLMSSTDVIHGFYVPDFRIKMDVLPNRYSIVWFNAPSPGQHQIFCTQYCGKGHSEMWGTVHVLSEREYAEWLEQSSMAGGAGMKPEDFGKNLYQTKRCITCHSIDGTANVGPSFLGIFGNPVPLEGGNKVIVDENYIRESILDPQAKIALGYQPVMPTYQGILKDKDIDGLIAYIKSLHK